MLLEAIDPDVDKHAQINDFAFVKTASPHGLIGYKRGAASSFPFIRRIVVFQSVESTAAHLTIVRSIFRWVASTRCNSDLLNGSVAKPNISWGPEEAPPKYPPRHSYLYLFIHGLFWKSLIIRKYGRNKPGIFRLFMIHVVGTVPWNTFLAEKNCTMREEARRNKIERHHPQG